MNTYLALTDYRWFTFLASLPKLEEINFWQPGGNRAFGAIQPNELFLFKLHSPREFIVGGGFFAHSSLLPVSLAWDAFGTANGAASLEQMRAHIEQYRRQKPAGAEDYRIGCILLSQPFFLKEADWIPVPKDWSPNIVQGKTYDLTIEPGLTLYRQLQERLSLSITIREEIAAADVPAEKYGAPMEILPRLGQGIFRVVIIDAYGRRCAVTGEKVLPVLDAAHIKPYSKDGTHKPDNGILIRSDLHTLFDLGYVTITPQYRFEVSKHIPPLAKSSHRKTPDAHCSGGKREDYENGHEYYALHGQAIHVPEKAVYKPAGENLAWHNENVYKG
ncbi:MAG: HNH endonuclease [Anaerolineales bacterium]